MSSSQLNQLLLLHPVRFVCDAISEFAKEHNTKVYSLSAQEEFAFIINDLKPEFVLIHESFLKQSFFTDELARSIFKDFKIVSIGEVAGPHKFLAEPLALELVIPQVKALFA